MSDITLEALDIMDDHLSLDLFEVEVSTCTSETTNPLSSFVTADICIKHEALAENYDEQLLSNNSDINDVNSTLITDHSHFHVSSRKVLYYRRKENLSSLNLCQSESVLIYDRGESRTQLCLPESLTIVTCTKDSDAEYAKKKQFLNIHGTVYILEHIDSYMYQNMERSTVANGKLPSEIKCFHCTNRTLNEEFNKSDNEENKMDDNNQSVNLSSVQNQIKMENIDQTSNFLHGLKQIETASLSNMQTEIIHQPSDLGQKQTRSQILTNGNFTDCNDLEIQSHITQIKKENVRDETPALNHCHENICEHEQSTYTHNPHLDNSIIIHKDETNIYLWKGSEILTAFVHDHNYYQVPEGDCETDLPIKDNQLNKPINYNQLNKPIKDNQLNKPIKDNKLNKPIKDNQLNKPIKENKLNNPTKDNKLNKQIKDNKLTKPIKDNKLNKRIKDNKLNKQYNYWERIREAEKMKAIEEKRKLEQRYREKYEEMEENRKLRIEALRQERQELQEQKIIKKEQQKKKMEEKLKALREKKLNKQLYNYWKRKREAEEIEENRKRRIEALRQELQEQERIRKEQQNKKKEEKLKAIEENRKLKKVLEQPVPCPNCKEMIISKNMGQHEWVCSGEPFLCLFCGILLRNRRELYNHENSHDERLRTCNICHKTFENRRLWISHKRRLHKNKPKKHKSNSNFLCSICGKTFAHKTSLWKHTETHSDEGPYKCRNCDAEFRLRGYLKSHMRFCPFGKIYSCTESGCNREFQRKESWRNHKKWHRTYRTAISQGPFKCSDCDAEFRLRRYLQRHIRVWHLPPKSCTCTESGCERMYHIKESLQKHKQLHQKPKADKDVGPFQCKYCDAEFNSRKGLQHYIGLCHCAEKKFSCTEPGCEKKYKFKDSLRRHEKWHQKCKTGNATGTIHTPRVWSGEENSVLRAMFKEEILGKKELDIEKMRQFIKKYPWVLKDVQTKSGLRLKRIRTKLYNERFLNKQSANNHGKTNTPPEPSDSNSRETETPLVSEPSDSNSRETETPLVSEPSDSNSLETKTHLDSELSDSNSSDTEAYSPYELSDNNSGETEAHTL